MLASRVPFVYKFILYAIIGFVFDDRVSEVLKSGISTNGLLGRLITEDMGHEVVCTYAVSATRGSLKLCKLVLLIPHRNRLA